MSFIDAHLHLQDVRFADSLDSIVAGLRASRVTRWVVNGTSPDDWSRVKVIAEENPEAIAGYGLHPWKVNSFGIEGLDKLESFLRNDPSAIVGEIGLDRWIRDHDIGLQKSCFLRQLELANTLGRSSTIHCLQSWGHLFDCLKEVTPSKPFLLHSYGGPREMIDEFLAMGARFSLSGYFFREDKAAKLETFSGIPIDRILLESDAPDMLPPEGMIEYPLEGALNHPCNLVGIYRNYAERIGVPLEEVIEQMDSNFREWHHEEEI